MCDLSSADAVARPQCDVNGVCAIRHRHRKYEMVIPPDFCQLICEHT